MDERRRKEIRGILVSAVAFCAVAPAFGATKQQRSEGGSWFHAYLAPMPFIFAAVTVLVIAMIVGSRSRGDGMPAAVWKAPVHALDGEVLAYQLGRGHRAIVMLAFGCIVMVSPFAVINALQDGPGATIFVGFWLLAAGIGLRSVWRSSVVTVVLSQEILTVEMIGGGEESVALGAVTEIRWPNLGKSVIVAHEGGELRISNYFKGLDDLVIQMRRRNPAIRFDGAWPPANLR